MTSTDYELTKARRGGVVCLTIGLFFIVTSGLLYFTSPAYPHDVYKGLQKDGSRDPNGSYSPCCGGDPVTGDCEALDEHQYQVLNNGDVVFSSKRYSAKVTVPRDKVVWLPVDDKPAHWCGKPRANMSTGYSPGSSGVSTMSPTAEQPDPVYWTYCAFVAPGGV